MRLLSGYQTGINIPSTFLILFFLFVTQLRRRHQYVKDPSPWAMDALNDVLKTTVNRTPDRSKGDYEPSPSSPSTVANMAVKPDPTKTSQTTANNTPSVRMVHGHRDLHASGFSLSGKLPHAP